MSSKFEREIDSKIDHALDRAFEKIEERRSEEGILPSDLKKMLSTWDIGEFYQTWWEAGDGEWE